MDGCGLFWMGVGDDGWMGVSVYGGGDDGWVWVVMVLVCVMMDGCV